MSTTRRRLAENQQISPSQGPRANFDWLKRVFSSGNNCAKDNAILASAPTIVINQY